MKLGFLAAVSVFTMCLQPSSAALIVYEDFNYSVGDLNNENGGTGWGGKWVKDTSSNTDVVAGSLDDPNDLLTANNHASVTGSATGDIYTRSLTTAIGVDGTTRYLSFLLSPDSTLDTSNWFGLALREGGAGDIFFGILARTTTFGIDDETLNGTDDADSLISATLGTTALLVIKMQFNTSGTDDVFSMYINPNPGSAEPTADATYTYDFAGQDIGTLVLNSSDSVSYDEIRIGTTYADVTPVAPLPNAAAMGVVLLLILWIRQRPKRSIAA